ncbi:MAG: right-handed parallel beta-helix repeat-containing protein [Akkermansiaceae bacterium]|nr:right-handed parallel beta-helix repeat-containing protein [Akkermansiaceae bacterium]
MILRCLLVSTCLAVPAFAGEISVSPDRPFSAILEAARKEPKPVTVVMQAGTYPITEAVALGAADSGIHFRNAEGAAVVIDGGRRITGWTKQADGLWRAEVPEVREGKWYFQQLWINGRRATRARTPNKGFLHMEDRATSAIFPGEKPGDEKWEAALKYQAFTTSAPTFAIFQQIKPEETGDVEIIIPHTWDVHHYHLKQLNPAANAVLMHGPRMRELLTNEPDGRFHMENYRAALDAPGEWFLSRSGELLYSPLPGEDLSKAEVSAPVSQKLVTIDGAKDIRFTGISFRHQQWVMGPDGYGDPQAAHMMGAAVEVDRSENIHFDNCEISHTGGYALWFRHDVAHSSVKHSHLHDLGAGGVRIGPTTQPGSTKTTAFVTVDNNIIQHAGRIFPDAIGVFVGHASDCGVMHNDIGDLYYTGISAGWHWGYGETVAHRNRYENNHIHHIGWGYTSDMGGFYNLGTSLGTVVRGNHVHDISSHRYGGWGLYTDEGSTGLVFENNLVHDTRESGFHQHYGYYNTIRNNIFAFGKNAQIQRSRPEKRLSFIYENNIIVWNPDTAKLLHGTKYNWADVENRGHGDPKTAYVMRKNLYWPVTGKMPEMTEGWSWDEWRKQGRDGGSIIADPQFVDLAKRDFHLKPDSPALKLGFKPWDLSVAGVRSDGPRGKAWRELAEKADFPNWEEDSKPWPSPPWSIPMKTFEFAADGTLPIIGASADLSKEKKGDSISVTSDASSPIPLDGGAGSASPAPSKKSIKIQDAPGLTPSWLPVLNLHPKFAPGPIRISFDAMSRAGAEWFFEVRGGEFGAGPYLSWKDGKLAATTGRSVPLADIPTGEWFRVRMTATPGSGTWNVEITRQDGTRTNHPDIPCKKEWTKANLVLWSAISNADTAFHIDNLEMSGE